MALMILISGAWLCKAAEYPMPAEILYPAMLYAVIHDFFRSSTIRRIR